MRIPTIHHQIMFLGMGHGGNPLSVTFVHLLNEAKNLGKTSPIVGNLIVGNF